MLHEALDLAQSGMLGVAEPHRDLALDVERQPFLRPPREKVHVAAHRPQEVAAAAEAAVFAPVIDAFLDQLLAFLHAKDIFRDPVKRVQVAQAALAVLDIGLDQITRLPGAAMPFFALGELGSDEFGAGALHHLLVEARQQFIVELALAEQEACLQNGGADGHVRLGLADGFADGARGVADLQPHVP